MTDGGPGKSDPKAHAILHEGIVSQSRAAMAELFSKTIAALADDLETSLKEGFKRDLKIEAAVTELTTRLIHQLAGQVASALPTEPPHEDPEQSQARPSTKTRRKPPPRARRR